MITANEAAKGEAMAQIIQLGQPPIDVTLRRSARARRLSLRVSGLDGKVSLTLPGNSSLRQAEAFLEEKERWIRKHINQAVVSRPVAVGRAVPVEGRKRVIVEGPGKRVQLTDDHLIVPQGQERAGRRACAFLKTMARDRLDAASVEYAAQLGRSFGKITLRDTRSRWGSCTSEANLMFSWRLILAPPEILRYVAAHEVAHLAEMNHSPAFWAEVAGLMPDYQTPRKWLKKNGMHLHSFQF